MGNLTKFPSKSIYNILYNKSEMQMGAFLLSTDFAIIISISNTRGFGAFLQNIRIIIIFTYITCIIHSIYRYICLKCTQFLKINAKAVALLDSGLSTCLRWVTFRHCVSDILLDFFSVWLPGARFCKHTEGKQLFFFILSDKIMRLTARRKLLNKISDIILWL